MFSGRSSKRRRGHRSHRWGGTVAATAIACTSLLSLGCTDRFTGAVVVVDFASTINENFMEFPGRGTRLGGVTGPAPAGMAPTFPAQAPADTQFSLYWTERGNDAEGNPATFTFKAADFELKPIINIAEPCFYDQEPSLYPGVHVDFFLDRIQGDFGFTSQLDAPADATDDQLTQMVLATRREFLLPLEQLTLLAVTSASTSPGPAVDTVCADDSASDPGLVPPPSCTDDESNARRIDRCEAFFEDNPNYYVGSDRVFAQPLGGEFRGTVYSLDPRNQTGLARLMGASFVVDGDMDPISSLFVSWQFKDLDGDGEPDYPDTFPMEDRSPTGVTYMSGTPNRDQVRGTININMANLLFPQINGEATVLGALGEDNVSF